MLRVLYTCLSTRHDVQLVILAGVICVVACVTAINLFARARERTGWRGLLFAALAATVFGAGVWATHFVAELAFTPGLPIAYNFDLTAASMFVAIGVAWLGTLIALQADRPIVGGAIMGLAVGAMHYTGMAALQVPAQAQWHPFYLAGSIIIGALGVASAIWLLCRRPAWHNRFYATGLLVAAICGLHFAAMAALILVPDPAIPVPSQGIAPSVLTPAVAAVTIAIVALGMLVSALEEHAARRAVRDAEQLHQNQAHLARVLRISGIGCVERDLQTGLIVWSPEARLIFGLAADQQADTREDFYRFVHPDDRERVEAATRHSDLGLPSPPLEYRIVRPNGDVRVVYRENDVLLDEADRPVRRISVFKDITEEHAARDRE